MAKRRRLHYKDLDALRFLAFIPFFLFAALYILNTGENQFISDGTSIFNMLKQNSLDFFFFISSFLLTAHALREKKYTNNFSVKSFYIRRIMRILPVFFVCVIFAFVIHPWITTTLKLTELTTVSVGQFFAEFPLFNTGINKEQYIYLAVIWTVFMFLQFYLFWGLVLKFFIDNIKYVGFVLIAIGIASRVFHVLVKTTYEFNLLSAFIPIGIGAIAAHIIRKDQRTVELIKHYPKTSHLFVYITGIVFILGGYLFLGKTVGAAVIPLITCSFYGYVFVEQTYGKNSLFKLRKSKILTRWGKMSYGLIMYSPILMLIGVISADAFELNLSSPVFFVGFVISSFLASWILADLSYNFYERPILTIKKDFKRS